MSDYLLADRAVDAFVSILTEPVRTALGIAAGKPVPVVPEKTSRIREAPIVTVSAEVGEETPVYTGNFMVEVAISVRFKGTEQPGQTVFMADAEKILVSAVNNALYVDDLEAQLTAAADDFHVFKGSCRRLSGTRKHDPVANCIDDIISFRILACASDLAA